MSDERWYEFARWLDERRGWRGLWKEFRQEPVGFVFGIGLIVLSIVVVIWLVVRALALLW